jgi:hypothetical protein
MFDQPQQPRMAATPQEATVALAFCQQAIRILEIAHDFANKEEVQSAAAAHLLMVFGRPAQPYQIAPVHRSNKRRR